MNLKYDIFYFNNLNEFLTYWDMTLKEFKQKEKQTYIKNISEKLDYSKECNIKSSILNEIDKTDFIDINNLSDFKHDKEKLINEYISFYHVCMIDKNLYIYEETEFS